MALAEQLRQMNITNEENNSTGEVTAITDLSHLLSTISTYIRNTHYHLLLSILSISHSIPLNITQYCRSSVFYTQYHSLSLTKTNYYQWSSGRDLVIINSNQRP